MTTVELPAVTTVFVAPHHQWECPTCRLVNGTTDRPTGRRVVCDDEHGCRQEYVVNPTDADVHGWAYVEFEAIPPVDSRLHHAAIVERQLVAIFNEHTDTEARATLTTWNPACDLEAVFALRDLADEVHRVEWAMPETSYDDLMHAQSEYAAALIKLAASLRPVAAPVLRLVAS